MSFGGKADNLLRLKNEFTVPKFFVIPADESLEYVEGRFDKLGVEKVAVRSSAGNEDGRVAAWAGQLETYLDVPRAEIKHAVAKCRVSADSEHAKTYAQEQGAESGDVAVIVQKMVDARVSGVAFSRHPVTGNNTVVVEAVRGLGEKLVSGHVTPDTYVENEEAHIAGSETVILQEEVQEIVNLCRNVEQFLGYPVDIEWAYEEKTLYLLQARPITTV